jgi:hypothetical protein
MTGKKLEFEAIPSPLVGWVLQQEWGCGYIITSHRVRSNSSSIIQYEKSSCCVLKEFAVPVTQVPHTAAQGAVTATLQHTALHTKLCITNGTNAMDSRLH